MPEAQAARALGNPFMRRDALPRRPVELQRRQRLQMADRLGAAE